jgi:hypothetical protein
MAGQRKLSLFEQRKRMIDDASGWGEEPAAPTGPVIKPRDTAKPVPKKPKAKGLRRLW